MHFEGSEGSQDKEILFIYTRRGRIQWISLQSIAPPLTLRGMIIRRANAVDIPRILKATWTKPGLYSLVVLNSYQPYNWFNFIVRRKERNLPTERPSFVVSDEMRPENSLQECGGVSSGGIDKLIDNLFWECTTVIIPCPLVITLRGKLSSR